MWWKLAQLLTKVRGRPFPSFFGLRLLRENHVSLIAWRQCWLLTHLRCAYWSVSTALELLVSHRITGLPVVDDMGRLVWCLPFPSRGIFSLWPIACKQRASNFLASTHKRTISAGSTCLFSVVSGFWCRFYQIIAAIVCGFCCRFY